MALRFNLKAQFVNTSKDSGHDYAHTHNKINYEKM